MESTSESLLLRLRSKHDQRAWATFVELYTPLIFYWGRKIGLQANDAADLVQDVLTLACQKIPAFEYDSDGSFRGWLRTVTLNRYREKLRKKSIGAAPTTQSALASIEQPSQAESTWDLNYQQALIQRAMEIVEHEFQPATWRALKNYVLEGIPAATAAANHDVSVWTVYAAKSRLMTRLRETLDGLL